MISDAGLYASTGYRLNGTGVPADNSRMGRVVIENDVFFITGYDGAVFQNAESVAMDGFVCLPPPGLPMLASRLDFNTVDTADLSNIAFTHFLDEAFTISGNEVEFDQQTSGAADSIDQLFPQYAGSVESMQHYAAGNYFVPDHVNFSHHPNEIRAFASAALMRGSGWSDPMNLTSDPAGWDAMGWGAAPTVTPPEITSSTASMDGSSVTVTATVTEASRIYWTVTEIDDTPNPVAARQHRLTDGRAAGPQNGDSQDVMPDRGVVIAEIGVNDIPVDRSRLSDGASYRIIMVAEGEAGTLSDVVRTVEFRHDP
ncbi:hypothetical protein KMP13_02390 [Epibacterium ulvae]|uniref:hypothetical protein n=1 Tax=Epibacterium ulvae TaxID=1156985 RepID=UPI001BFCBF7F|nr:hypothetical protein [Epibacterium ulvae]MBT8152763.1 hypothetical protein [Epibacterium ulvae]